MKKYIFLATAAIAMTACNNDYSGNGPVEAIITAGVGTPQSRAVNDLWEKDRIGVMVTDAPASNMEDLYKNVEYTTETDGEASAYFTAATKGIFFQDAGEEVTFAAYGPYQASAPDALPGNEGVISGSTELQSERELQKAFDYIYASGATSNRTSQIVKFEGANQFSHKMTRLIITVKTSDKDGFTADEVTGGTYTLGGLNHNGQFDVTTGTAQATATAAAEAAGAWSLTDNSLKTEDTETKTVTFTSILYPQTLQNALTFTAIVAGQTYTNNTGIKPALVAGQSYTYTITVKKTGISLKGCTIADWGTGEIVNGGNLDADLQ